MSTIGFCPSGSFTPGSRVQGKFSIHEACDATGSMACTLAQVSGAFHQLWKSTRHAGWSAVHSAANCCTALLPPWPLTMRMRLKPLCAMLSRMSRTTRRCVSTRSEIEPGNSRKYGVTPYATTGKTGTPSGSAASAATRSGRMQSTVSRR